VSLKTPPRRIGAKDTRIPAAVQLARAVLPQTDDIAAALTEMAR
jgi:acetoin:2,6-dichlorophenolindophenol oxidoreductase subunit beta